MTPNAYLFQSVALAIAKTTGRDTQVALSSLTAKDWATLAEAATSASFNSFIAEQLRLATTELGRLAQGHLSKNRMVQAAKHTHEKLTTDPHSPMRRGAGASIAAEMEKRA